MCPALSLSIAHLAHITLLRVGSEKEQLYASSPIGERRQNNDAASVVNYIDEQKLLQ